MMCLFLDTAKKGGGYGVRPSGWNLRTVDHRLKLF